MFISASLPGEQVVVLLPVRAADIDLGGDDLSTVVAAAAQLAISSRFLFVTLSTGVALALAAAALSADDLSTVEDGIAAGSSSMSGRAVSAAAAPERKSDLPFSSIKDP